MCRHLGYLGPAIGVGEILRHGSNSLVRQSWAPTDMRGGGTVNADGFGAAWWTGGRAVAYRNAMPIWSDPAVTDTLAHIEATAVVAAVRSATEGMPVERSACAPFVDGPRAFSHNGVVRGWPGSMVDLVAEVPAADLLTLPAPTDSAAVWVLLAHRLRTADPDHDPGAVLARLARDIDSAAPGSRLNFLLSDGRALYATALDHSLSVLRDGTVTMIASEPVDAREGWTPVPDRSVVTATLDRLDIRPL